MKTFIHGNISHLAKSFLIPMEKYVPGEKYVLLYECRQNTRKKDVWNHTLPFNVKFNTFSISIWIRYNTVNIDKYRIMVYSDLPKINFYCMNASRTGNVWYANYFENMVITSKV